MQFFSDLMLGYKSYGEAWKFIVKHQMWVYFLFPLLVFGGLIYFGFWMQGLAGDAARVADDASFFLFIWYKLKFMTLWVIATLSLNLTRYIMMTVLSPVLSVVSQRVERKITGNSYSFNLAQTLKDIRRGIKISIRNVIREVVLVSVIYVVAAFVSWLLGINLDWISVSLSLLVAFYFYGFGFMDYINERQRLSIPQSVNFVRKHWGVAVALGSVFVFIFQILFPVFEDNRYLFILGAITVSAIPIFSIVAATLAVHSLVDLSTNEYAEREIHQQ